MIRFLQRGKALNSPQESCCGWMRSAISIKRIENEFYGIVFWPPKNLNMTWTKWNQFINSDPEILINFEIILSKFTNFIMKCRKLTIVIILQAVKRI